MEVLRRLRLPTASLPTKLMVALSVLVTVVIAGSATFLVERERGNVEGFLAAEAFPRAEQ